MAAVIAAPRAGAAGVAAAAVVLAACRALPEGAECVGLDGRPLRAPELPAAERERLESDLAAARRAFATAPTADTAIWVGRRLGYLGRYREAVAVYTEALRAYPGDPRLLRHRGHRFLSLHDFAAAERDLARAAALLRVVDDEIEPDGHPVAGRPPHSTLHFNVHYHLGLARWLRRDFAGAERAWLDCLAVAANDESRVAVVHWLWCARMRCGDAAGARAAAATIRPTMDVVENRSYHQLCLLYRGDVRAADLLPREGSAGAALAFGLAHFELATGSADQARRRFEELARSPGWAAFGVIAASAELHALR